VSNANQASSFRPLQLNCPIRTSIYANAIAIAITLRMRIAISSTWDLFACCCCSCHRFNWFSFWTSICDLSSNAYNTI